MANPRQATAPAPLETTPADVHADALAMFRALLAIDTTNPPGDEAKAVDYARTKLEEVGVACEVIEAEPGRSNLLARVGPAAPCIALSAHVDVVPADPAKWTHPPFGAVEANGCIWGRGAIDMKHMAAYGLAILRDVARRGLARNCGLKLLLFADEEAGCQRGSLFVARTRPDWLRAELALTEVGGFTTWIDGHRVYPVQVAEKGFAWLRLRVHGSPGHGSMPRDDNAILRLADIVQQLSRQPFPFQCTQPVADFLDAVGAALGFPKGVIFRGIGSRALSQLILERAVREPDRRRPLAALLRHTVSPTVVRAGDKANVIPGEAELIVDCRMLPGTQPDDFVREFRQRVTGDYDIEVIQQGPPVVMDRRHPAVDAIFEVLREADPGCHPVPNVLTGFTDARAFAEVGTPCFGFSPIWLPPHIPFAAMFHGHDERIPVDGFRWGLAVLHTFVLRQIG